MGSTGRALLAVVALTAPADARVVFTSTDEVRACLPLPGGDTLAGTAGGLVRVDPAGLPLRVWTASDGLPGTRIDALAADGERVWVGTDGGVAEFAGDVSHAVATRPVRDIARWHGTTYLATWDGGVIALGPAPGTTGATTPGTAIAMRGGPAAQRMRASSLAVAGGTLWAGTAAGDGLPSRSVLSIARLSDGRIIAGTSVGAAVLGDDGIQRVGPRGLGDRGVGNVWAIAETSAGLWLGTTTGLYRGPATPWTSKDGSDDDAAVADRWQRLSVAGGQLRDDWVTALVTRGDVVWAGTYNGGVARIDGDTATPLGGGWVNPSGLVWDGDHLLAATMDGLVTGDGRTPTWTATPGLPGRDVTAAVRTGKTLWVATRRGLIGLD